uniref:Protein kinase domain-containing protein n=1 Tax=Amphora coffeiformis TaxID=265554 RepID=A0A7S3P484_9STRA|mmetsp:Transcript_3764/g.7483  ORF Transcript_3764/g.7483 Transcript_3764/m.7483 type:complete len:478 (+) Transcript_3764:820-2253(+)
MSADELIIIDNLEMYHTDMWSANNPASYNNVKYEDIEHAGPPAAPLEFPMPLIHRAQRSEVSVLDHVTGRVYHEKEVISRAPQPTNYGLRTVGPRRAYLLKKRIAPCTYGVVRLAIVLEQNIKQEETRDCLQQEDEAEWKSTGGLVAIKVLSCEQVRQNLSPDSSNPLNEVASLQLVGSYHPNVLGCDEVLQSEDELYIVTPYKAGKDLFQKLMGVDRNAAKHPQVQQHARPLKRPSERCAREWFKDLLRGMMHLQNKGICHRNLSLDNLLLDPDGKLVIADFGLALRVPYTDWSNFGGVTDASEGSLRRLILAQGHGGNTPYLAPELLKPGAPFDGFSVDMWAAGVILFLMLVGRAPFRVAHSSDPKFLTVAHKGQLRSLLQSLHIKISDDAVDLLQSLLWHDPRRRLTLQEALAHPWVTHDRESSESETSSFDGSKASKCVKFNPSSVCEDLNCRMGIFGEEALGRLSLGRMSSF